MSVKAKWYLRTAVLAALLMASAWMIWRLALDREESRRRATVRNISSLASLLFTYAVVHEGLVPGPSIEEAIKAILDDPYLADNVDWDDQFAAGRDAWGRKLVYEWNREDRRASIRSVGPNGVDERGAGDDFETNVVWPE